MTRNGSWRTLIAGCSIALAALGGCAGILGIEDVPTPAEVSAPDGGDGSPGSHDDAAVDANTSPDAQADAGTDADADADADANDDVYVPCSLSACPTIDADGGAFWRATNVPSGPGGGYDVMGILSSGEVVVWGASQHQKYDPATGAQTPITLDVPVDQAPGNTLTIFPKANPPFDGIYTSNKGAQMYDQTGSFRWQWPNFGCCDFGQSFAYDATHSVMWHSPGGATWGGIAVAVKFDVAWQAGASVFSPPNDDVDGSWLAYADNHLYFAGKAGSVQRVTGVNTSDWKFKADNYALRPGAIAADGSFVVASTGPNGTDGDLFIVPPTSATLANSKTFAAMACSSPVVAASGVAFVGSTTAPPGVRAYNAAGQVWFTQTADAPTDLLLADDGLLYAFGNGTIWALNQSDGMLRRTYLNLEASTERQLLLANRRLFAKTAHELVALPTVAHDYPTNAPWPVRRHDNGLRSGR